jgi:cytochrome b561
MERPAYSRSQVALHWLVAVLVAYEILFAGAAEAVWSARMTGAIPNEPRPTPHAVVGLAVLGLTLWRLRLRLTQGAPPPPGRPIHVRAAQAAFVAFYALLLALPLLGLAAWWTGRAPLADAHGRIADALIALILLHVAAALLQHFWLRTDALRRMTGL